MHYLLLFILVSCSNIHLKVKSAYETPSAKGQMEFEKSYDLASFPWICGATAIFWGGGCWAYNMMPTVPQENQVISDAQAALKEQLGPEAVIVNPTVDRESWGEVKPKLTVH